MQPRTGDFATQADANYNEPVLLVRILLTGGTQFLASRPGTYEGNTYQGLLKAGVGVSFGYQSSGSPIRANGRLVIANGKHSADDGAESRFSELFATETFDNAAIEIDQTFVGLGPGNALPVFRGVVEVPADAIDDEEVRLNVKDDGGPISADRIDVNNTRLNKMLGTLINETDNPDADINDYGKMQPIIYGSVQNSPCPSYAVGAADILREDLAAAGTELFLSDARRWAKFPASAFWVMIEDEIIYVATRTQVGDDLKLTGLIRDVSQEGSTTPGTGADHSAGRVVFLKRNYYDFVVADHPVKSVTNVRIGRHGVTAGSKFTPLEGWQAPNYDNGYTIINGSPTLIRFYSRRPGRIPDLSANAFGKHEHPQDNHVVQIPVTPALPIQGTESQILLYWPTDVTIKPGSNSIVHLITGVIVDPAGWTLLSRSGEILLDELLSEADIWLTDQNPENGVPLYYELTYSGAGSGPGHTIKFIERNVVDTSQGDQQTPFSSYNAEELLPRITCDVEGYQDDGVGSYTGVPNSLITNPADIVRHIVGVLLGTGPTEHIDEASFSQARIDFASDLIRADFGVYRQIDSAQLLEDFREGVAARLYLNAAGKFRLLVLPLTNTDTKDAALTELGDVVHPRSGGFPIRIGRTPLSDLTNRVVMRYRMDYYDGNFLGTVDISDQASIDLYRTTATYRMDNQFVRDDAAGSAVANKYLAWYKDQHWTAQAPLFGLPNLHLEPGDRVKITSARMPGGWSGKAFFIEQIDKALAQGRGVDMVGLTMRDE